MAKYPIDPQTLRDMHQAAFARYGMSPDTHGGLERCQEQADVLLDKLPEPLRNQVAAAVAPRKTLAQRVQEDQRDRNFDTQAEWIADTIATAVRIRAPEVRKRLLDFHREHGLTITSIENLSKEDIAALLGGRDE